MSLRPKKTSFTPIYKQIESYLDELYLYQRCKVESIKIYQAVYELCNSYPKAYDARLYKNLIKYFQNYTIEVNKKLISSSSEMITVYAEEWKKFHLLTKYVNNLFSYLNKTILAQRLAGDEDDELRLNNGNLADLMDGGGNEESNWNQDTGLDEMGEGREIPLGPILGFDRMSLLKLTHLIWKQQIVLQLQLHQQDTLMHHVFQLIESHRNYKLINLQPIFELNQSLILMENCNNEESEVEDLELYKAQFETPYLKLTGLYYKRQAAGFLGEGDMNEYMIKALERLQFEEDLISKICHESSYKKAIEPVEFELIINYQEKLNLAFQNFLINSQFEQCTLAYKLLNRIKNGLDPILQIFENFIIKLGGEEIFEFEKASTKDPRIYVEILLNLHTKFIQITQNTFLNDPQFIASVDKAFRRIINAKRDPKLDKYGQPPEMLAKYADLMLKKGVKPIATTNSATSNTGGSGNSQQLTAEISDIDPEVKLSNMIVLFKYIDDKDLFQKFYSRLLAKRLINNLSISEDQETLMVQKLKTECGPEYTTVLQRMITDLQVNRDLNNLFKAYLSSIEFKSVISTNFMILTTGAWPLNNSSSSTTTTTNLRSEFRVPEILNSSITAFQTYYHSQHTGRKLNWLWHLSKADITLNYLPKKYELNCSLYQMSLLYLFNDLETLTLDQIQTQLQLPLSDILNILKSLIDNKLLNPIESPLDQNLPKTQEFSLNLNYNNKRFKLKLTQSTAAEVQMEDKETVKKVEEDRKLYLQSVVVRIMKSRKVLTHTQLVQEVFELTQSQFKPSVPFIKQTIESLIDKQYMERSETNRDSYSYLA
ncbi:Cullin-domain-containing protein [Conidiobolus coronatus NRRL 28638]|uniref:Cullin-5 n=1 Tax=Conidiobolus coronatus (strain ATCC 28846 / CBS 209.66 / NRRL 28638) TaxID=796925 RepID=A0A137PAM2_CONC2|nr:Cullin-domain-containing protein [Conidiobolus coronatus NRRL 28638]|eukprot:KXN72068.1 Cullin-domain-containing protein [Conidiobolus coronatus NRRL 28638]